MTLGIYYVMELRSMNKDSQNGTQVLSRENSALIIEETKLMTDK